MEEESGAYPTNGSDVESEYIQRSTMVPKDPWRFEDGTMMNMMNQDDPVVPHLLGLSNCLTFVCKQLYRDCLNEVKAFTNHNDPLGPLVCNSHGWIYPTHLDHSSTPQDAFFGTRPYKAKATGFWYNNRIYSDIPLQLPAI